MSSFRDVIARMAVDAEFARYARANPDDVARRHGLTTEEAGRLRELADAPAGTGPVSLGARLSKSGIGTGLANALAEALEQADSEEPEDSTPFSGMTKNLHDLLKEEPEEPEESGSPLKPALDGLVGDLTGGEGDDAPPSGMPLQAAASLLAELEIPPEPVQPDLPAGPIGNQLDDLKEQLGLGPSDGEAGGAGQGGGPGGGPTLTGPTDAMLNPNFMDLVPATEPVAEGAPAPAGPEPGDGSGGGSGGEQPPSGQNDPAPSGQNGPAPATPAAPAPSGQTGPAPSGPGAPAPSGPTVAPGPARAGLLAGADQPVVALGPTGAAAGPLATPGAPLGSAVPGPAAAAPGAGAQSLLPPEPADQPAGGGGISPTGIALAAGGAALGAAAGGLAGAAAGRSRAGGDLDEEQPPRSEPGPRPVDQ